MRNIIKILPSITGALIGNVSEVSGGKGGLSLVLVFVSFCCLTTPFKIGFVRGAIKINSFGAEYIRIII